MESEWDSDPLILLHAAIIMGIGKNEVMIFIKRVLFEVKAWGIDMSAQNPKAFDKRLFADDEGADVLVLVDEIDFVAWLDASKLGRFFKASCF